MIDGLTCFPGPEISLFSNDTAADNSKDGLEQVNQKTRKERAWRAPEKNHPRLHQSTRLFVLPGNETTDVKNTLLNKRGNTGFIVKLYFLDKDLLVFVDCIILWIVQEIEGIDLQVYEVCIPERLELFSVIIQPEYDDPVRHPFCGDNIKHTFQLLTMNMNLSYGGPKTKERLFLCRLSRITLIISQFTAITGGFMPERTGADP